MTGQFPYVKDSLGPEFDETIPLFAEQIGIEQKKEEPGGSQAIKY